MSKYESAEYMSSQERAADDQRIREKAARGEALTDEEAERLEELIIRDVEEGRTESAQREARLAAQDPTNERAYRRSGPGMVDTFLQKVQAETFRPISSGMPALDWAIGGGFIRQSVILLGAAPGMGKTALMSQICEHIASAGQPVLYFNLEMSREVMLARSLSRIISQDYEHTLSAAEILRGYEWGETRRSAVEEAAEAYKETIAKYLLYNPKDGITDLTEIMMEVEKRKAELVKQGYKAPILCVDYLQLITGRPDEDAVEVIKRAMMLLKMYANDNDTLVFVVSANNRGSNQSGKSDLNSGRDSSTIEYGADLHMGIEYDALRPKYQPDGAGGWKKGEAKDMEYIHAIRAKHMEWMRSVKLYGNLYAAEYAGIEKEYRRVCTRCNIRINKNRYGESGAYAQLVFEGEGSYFRELTDEEKREERQRRTMSNLPRI